MEYRVRFYSTEDGEKPVADFLKSLLIKNRPLHDLVDTGLKKLRNRNNHGKPLTDAIEGSIGILELRVGRAEIARVFFFFRPGQEIVCTHGYVKKTQKVEPAEVRRAERYKADWETRYP